MTFDGTESTAGRRASGRGSRWTDGYLNSHDSKEGQQWSQPGSSGEERVRNPLLAQGADRAVTGVDHCGGLLFSLQKTVI